MTSNKRRARSRGPGLRVRGNPLFQLLRRYFAFQTRRNRPSLLRSGECQDAKLDPPVEPIKPSYHHCVEIAPQKTTTYTITADDGAGHTKSLSLEVKVH